MTRRAALRSLAGTAAFAALTGPAAATTGESSSAKRSAAFGPSPAVSARTSFRHSVCKWCYADIPLEEFAAAAAAIGLDSIELVNPSDAAVLERHGLTCAMANGATTINQGLNRLENHATQVPGMIERIKECARVGYPNVIVFSGNRDGMSDDQGLEHCVAGVRQLIGAAEHHGVTVCMELLNSRVDHHDYMCDRTQWGVELVKRVGSERFKLLYDIYHMQIMEGDVIRTIEENHAYIGHYHTAGNPGRHEFGPDDPQELNYRAIMRAIHATGFRGFVGQEFIPARDPVASLREAVGICTV